MKVLLADSKYWDKLDKDFQKQYISNIKLAYKKALKLLPFAHERITFIVQPREYWLADITKDNGRTLNAGMIEVAFDPKTALTNPSKLLGQVQPLVLHEMNHAARYNKKIMFKTFLENCVNEGVAVVFTREYVGFKAPWDKYPKEVTGWLKEIQEAGKCIDTYHYMFMHPDGRPWIGYKVGTYIVDQAMKNSGKSVIELTKLECADILKLARVKSE